MWIDLFLQKSVLNNSEIFLFFPDIIYQNPDFLCHIVKAPREHRNLVPCFDLCFYREITTGNLLCQITQIADWSCHTSCCSSTEQQGNTHRNNCYSDRQNGRITVIPVQFRLYSHKIGSFQIDIVLDSGLYQCRQIFDITVKIFHSLIIRSPFFNLFIQILYTKTE